MPKVKTSNLWLRKAVGLPPTAAYKPGKIKQLLVESSSYANELAGRLADDVYRVELSKVISKYIGETEKNLEAVFKNAEEKGAVLFFDEADALFGKRTGVNDAYDRYAMQAAPILKRLLKRYTGITIIGLKQCNI